MEYFSALVSLLTLIRMENFQESSNVPNSKGSNYIAICFSANENDASIGSC